jgi:hypothetical protein
MKEITINGERLKLLVREAGIDFKPGTYDIIPEKKNLRYQIALPIHSGKTRIGALTSIRGEKYFRGTIDLCCIYYLVRLKEPAPSVTYERDDIEAILEFLGYLPVYYNKVATQIARGLGKAYPLSLFSDAYGYRAMCEVTSHLSRIIPSSDKTDEEFMKAWNELPDIDRTTPVPGPRAEYSVYRLCHDLVEDKAGILIDNTLVKYNRITREMAYTETEVFNDKSYQVIGLCGNKTRANLSLTYEIPKDEIKVPENPYGITASGLRMTRNYCVIRDGRLNMKSLAVRISKKLAGKFKILGLLNMELIREDEYVISLEKLPILRPRDIKPTSGYYLGYLEMSSAWYGAKKNYLEVLKYRSMTEAEKEAEKFRIGCHISIGVVDKKLEYNKPKKGAKDGHYTYTAYTLKPFGGLPKYNKESVRGALGTTGARTYLPNIRKYSWLWKVIDAVDQELSGSTVTELLEKYTALKEKTDSMIHEKVFEAIYNKRINFPDSNDLSGKIDSFGWSGKIEWDYTITEIEV